MKDEIIRCLESSHPWIRQIRYYDSIESTNTAAKALAETDAPHGTVLIAVTQTGGRGRMGRSFHSPAGSGLYLSVILRPQCQASDLMHLTCGVAVAVCDAIENTTGFRPGVKWINDIVANRKKLGGILTELSLHPDGFVRYAIIGIGLNCKHVPGSFPPELLDIAVSLEHTVGTPVSVSQLAAALLVSLEALSRHLTERKVLMDRYRRDCITLGKTVCIIRGEETVQGVALALEDDGSLLVQAENKEIIRVNSGEVQVRGLYGYC